MKFLSNLSIRMKIMLLLAAPVLGLVFFSADIVYEKSSFPNIGINFNF